MDSDLDEDPMLIQSWADHYLAHVKAHKKVEFLEKFGAHVRFIRRITWGEILKYCHQSNAEDIAQSVLHKAHQVHPLLGKSDQEIMDYNRMRKKRMNDLMDGKTV
jgi:hypothetical protein